MKLEIFKDNEFFLKWIEMIPTKYRHVNICKFIENNRYLPSNVSHLAGHYSFSIFPMHEEILSCMDPNSNVRDVTVMKGVQTGFTTITENVILYYAVQERGTPIMFVSALAELASERFRNNIRPMIEHSGFGDQIQPFNPKDFKRSGATDQQIEFNGGSYIVARGAQSPNKARSASIKVMIQDESSSYPVGKNNSQGDIIELYNARCTAFWAYRKIIRGSTPLVQETDLTWQKFISGDQRHYYIKCLDCRMPFYLKFRHPANEENGVVGGLFWKLDENKNLINESVRYHCPHCGHAHQEADKSRLLQKNNAEWVPHNPLQSDEFRSYHLSSLYSPTHFQPWYKGVADAIRARDWDTNETLDHEKLQSFYNNILGMPFVKSSIGTRMTLEKLSRFRRSFYYSGQIPNHKTKDLNRSKIALLTCAVDVQKAFLAVAVFGWARGCSPYLIEYRDIKGNILDLNDPAWETLEDMILNKRYKDQDGTEYRITTTAIDTNFEPKIVQTAAAKILKTGGGGNIICVRGRDNIKSEEPFKASKTFEIYGVPVYNLRVSDYKDHWYSQMELNKWIDGEQQPDYTINFPADTRDDQIKELTCETKTAVKDPKTNRTVKHIWKRKSNVRNELWDLLVYNTAVLDIIAKWRMVEILGEKSVNYDKFFNDCEVNQTFVGRWKK